MTIYKMCIRDRYLCAQKTADFNEFTEGGFPVKVRSSVKPICEKCKMCIRDSMQSYHRLDKYKIENLAGLY